MGASHQAFNDPLKAWNYMIRQWKILRAKSKHGVNVRVKHWCIMHNTGQQHHFLIPGYQVNLERCIFCCQPTMPLVPFQNLTWKQIKFRNPFATFETLRSPHIKCRQPEWLAYRCHTFHLLILTAQATHRRHRKNHKKTTHPRSIREHTTNLHTQRMLACHYQPPNP